MDRGKSHHPTLPAEMLLQRILEGAQDDGQLANDLLSEFFQGYPVTELRRLLQAPKESVVEVGVWLASELGSKGRPLIEDLVVLLDHPSTRVRFFAIDFMMTNIRADDAHAIRGVLDLINDPAQAVRTEAMKFLAIVPDDVALAAKHGVQPSKGHEVEARGLELVVGAVAAKDTVAIGRGLVDHDQTVRRYAAAAAARLRSYDRRTLELALRSDDPDVNTFATEIAMIGVGRTH